MKKFLLPLTVASTFTGVVTFLSTGNAFAEHHSHSAIHEVVISASPLGELSSGVGKASSLLYGDQLRTRSAATIGETLQNEMGVTNSGFGPAVGKPVIRGQSDNRVKVLQDSLSSMDASASSADHAITVEPLLAKRIEVLRGPATLRYGNGAIGGIVNVIDNRIPDAVPQELTGAIETRHNAVSDLNNNVFFLEGGKNQVAWHIDGLYRDSNNLDIKGFAQERHAGEEFDEDETTRGFIANTDTQTQSTTFGLSWVGEKGFIGIALNKLDNQYGIPPGSHGHEEEEDHADDDHDEEEAESVRINMEQTRVDLKSEWRSDIVPGFESGRLRISHSDYMHIELENGSPGTRFSNDAWEARLELIHNPIHNWLGAVGLQLENRDFEAVGDEAFITPSTINSQGAFWVIEKQENDWSYEAGVRFEHQNIDPDTLSSISHNTLSFSFGALWKFSDRQELNITVNRAQRAPSLEALLSDGPHLATGTFDLGDASLDEETSHNIDIGYHLHGPIELNLNLFYNRIDDFIFKNSTGEEDPESELPISQFKQEDAKFKGIEVQLETAINNQWRIKLFSDYVRAKLQNNGDVPRIPPLRYGAALNYLSGQWQGEIRLTEAEEQNHAGNTESETAGYTRLTANLSYQLKSDASEWVIFLKGHNLLDEEIRNATSFLREFAPEGGRGLELGMRISF